MNQQRFAALIVDDEPALRRLTATALSRFNFSCDEASDGEEAGNLVCRRKYDVVVTDLRMPKRNGHALAVELLSVDGERPLIVVLTGVLEPRLTSDLIARGVDQVEFKPINFPSFAAKVRALCERRSRLQRRADECPLPGQPGPSLPEGHVDCVTPQELEERMDALASALPVSPAAIEAANLIQSETPNADLVVRCIARDPGLTVAVLKMANSVHYNPSGQRADDLQTAILRLGYRKIGEVALASATLQTLTKSALPWVDASLVWSRCLAVSQVIEHLRPTAVLGGDDEGLFLSATLMPLSQVFVGLLIPSFYERLIARCRQTDVALASLERELLPMPPEMVLANYLARTGLSARLHKPLMNSATPYANLANLSEPLRTKVVCLKIAAFLGQLAVGRYAPWDQIDFPSDAVMRRVQLEQVDWLVDRVRQDLTRLPSQAPAARAGSAVNPIDRCDSLSSEQRYYKLSAESYDLLAVLLQALGVRLEHVSREAACAAGPLLVNCLGVSDDRLTRFIDECSPCSTRIFVGTDQCRPANSPRGSFITLPCSFGRLSRHLGAAAVQGSSSD